MELTVTGLNAISSPTLHIWDWRVSLYLFLGGASAGLAIMASILHGRKGGTLAEGDIAAYLAPVLSPIILNIGMFFIFLDLERKLNVYSFYLTLQPLSPMSWGSWGLMVVMPVNIMFALAFWPESRYDLLRIKQIQEVAKKLQTYKNILAAANFGMGVFIGIYTGVLLSSFVARPLWNSAVLPVLFLTSAMSAGAAIMIIIASTQKVKLFFTKVDIWLVIAEMVLLPLFFYGQYTSSGAHRESILPFFSFSHEYFWYGSGLLILFIIFPIALVMKMLEIKEENQHHELTIPDIMKMNLSAIFVLIGGLIIRFTFVYAGQLSHL